ncbi:exodeoxyribonuclease VII large subunit [Jannaschia sp. W003]|uniref:exodeoxyribonuclease VII large subunit n=1 Tax=Jannaschia sp. W003 TaxID=2867012 RepID=UPI0021A6A3A0|nr:exodeoxyribonuclease VII large subunit [Jannaschia sp. W003]UWQ22786.1 exodeoxyribonuclease VII large subunit [Jannaschia sp. W003]
MDDLLEDDGPPGRNEPEFTVAELSGAVKRTLEDRFGRIRVRGEVGRVFRAKSGHLYFDVKDDRNVLACTTWKGQVAGLAVRPEEGLEVIVTGKLSAFGGQSKYNMNVDAVEAAGKGALMAMLEKRRLALAAEGLFEASAKRPLPFLPEVIGVVTSPQGAVIRDILHRLRDRFPRRVVIWPVAVQGRACAPEVSAAIRGFDAMDGRGPIPRPDLLIVARGGGSVEDLWGFNEEVVVRAAADCRIPLISAVGHETDTTLIDHAADRRAPTPTAAAEMAVPVRRDLAAHVDTLGERGRRAAEGRARRARQRLGDVGRGLPRPEALLQRPRTRLDRAAERLPAALRARAGRARLHFQRLDARASPEALRTRLATARARLEAVAARLAQAPGRRTERLRARLDRLAMPAPARLLRDPRRRFHTAAARLTSRPLTRAAERDGRRLGQAVARLASIARARQARLADRLRALDRLRQSLGHRETLARGFAIARSGERVVKTAAEARDAPALELEFADGRMRIGGARPAKAKDAPPDQGSLF